MVEGKTENTLRECFDTILRGDKNDSRLAARRVRKLLYSYIDSLPASPYKSVQMVLAELEDSCGRKYKVESFGRS